MTDACDIVAEELGVSPSTLFELMKRKPENDVERKLQRRITNEYDNLLETSNESRPSINNIRAEIGKQYGVDVDKAIAKEPNKRSDAEKEAVKAYAEKLYEDINTKEGTEPEQGTFFTDVPEIDRKSVV